MVCGSPARLSAPVSFTHVQVSEHLRVAQERFCTTVPRFPRQGPLETAFPSVISTIGALRLPAPNTELLMDSLPRSTLRLLVYSLAAETHRGVRPCLYRPVPQGRYELVDHRISQVPRESVPYLCPALRPRPVPADLTLAANPVQSPLFRTGRHQRVLISRLNHTASVSAAYASSSTLPYSHARLAFGCWLGVTGRELNPLDSDERFLSHVAGFLLS